jgi:integrase
MKMGNEHDVALSAVAVALLEALPRFQGSDLLFPAPRGGTLSDMALNAVMRRIHASRGGERYNDPKSARPAVPHGLRAAFSTWANDETEFAPELIEHALAHKVGSDVARAYNRGSALERRFALMDRWAAVLSGKIALGADGENVVAFNG